MLTPLDVKRQQFTKQRLGGYDPEQVHAFLERVATELEAEKEKQRALENRAAELEKKLEHYERVELALQEALETARETARVAQEAAEKRARVMLDEAELRAQEIVRDAETERHGLRQDLIRITSRQKEVAAKMRAFLLSELELLATFEGDDPVGFLKLETSSGGARQLHLHSGDEEVEAGKDTAMDLFESESEERKRGREGEWAKGGEEEKGGGGRGDGSDDGVQEGGSAEEQLLGDGEHSVTSQDSPIESGAGSATHSADDTDAEIDWKAVSDLEASFDDETSEEVVEEIKDSTPEEAENEQDGAEPETEHEPAALAADSEGTSNDTDRERIRRILEDLD